VRRQPAPSTDEGIIMNISTHIDVTGLPARRSGKTAPASHTSKTQPHDQRFALLTARVGLEPELAKRYTSDPVSVLAEFGLAAAEPVYGDAYRGADFSLVIDELDRSGANDNCYGCYSGMAPIETEDIQAALA
jgi:hypothetical protein